MMNDVKATDEIKKQALEKTEAVAAAIEQESKVESLIKAKGFADCVVYIEGENCNVVVKRTACSLSRRFKSPRLSPPSRRLSHKISRYPM